MKALREVASCWYYPMNVLLINPAFKKAQNSASAYKEEKKDLANLFTIKVLSDCIPEFLIESNVFACVFLTGL